MTDGDDANPGEFAECDWYAEWFERYWTDFCKTYNIK